MRAHTPPPPPSPLPTPGCIFLSVERVFKGCQCVPTPLRALTTPTAHTPPEAPRHYTDLARISYVFREYLKAANACPHPPAPSPPPPPTPHPTPASPLPTPGLHLLGV